MSDDNIKPAKRINIHRELTLIGVLLSFTGGGGEGGGHDLFVMEARKGALHRLFKQRAAELQASVNFLLLVYITCGHHNSNYACLAGSVL